MAERGVGARLKAERKDPTESTETGSVWKGAVSAGGPREEGFGAHSMYCHVNNEQSASDAAVHKGGWEGADTTYGYPTRLRMLPHLRN